MPDAESREEDIFAELEAATGKHVVGEAQLRQGLLAVADRAQELLKNRAMVHAEGPDFRLENIGPDDWSYGHLYLWDGKIRLAWRSTEADWEDLQGRDPDGPTYSVTRLGELPYTWLKVVVEERRLHEFLRCVVAKIKAEADSDSAKAVELGSLTTSPVREVSHELLATAEEFGFQRVMSTWRTAQAEVYADRERAVALACTLLESTLAAISKELKLPPEKDISIKGPMRSVRKALDMDPSQQAAGPLKGICGALSTLSEQIGVLRTHHSEAHGRAPDSVPLGVDQARLAVDAAGVLSTFLMRRLKSHLNTEPQDRGAAE